MLRDSGTNILIKDVDRMRPTAAAAAVVVACRRPSCLFEHSRDEFNGRCWVPDPMYLASARGRLYCRAY